MVCEKRVLYLHYWSWERGMEHRVNPNLQDISWYILTHTHSRLTLPVYQVWMGDHPWLQDPFKFLVSFLGWEESVILMAARDIHCYLAVGGGNGVFVNVGILPGEISLKKTIPSHLMFARLQRKTDCLTRLCKHQVKKKSPDNNFISGKTTTQ